MKSSSKLYKCSICGFLYKDKKWVDKCKKYCSSHKSCSMEITKHSVSRKK